jgi:hypothetical protein
MRKIVWWERVCVCVWERERERERKKRWATAWTLVWDSHLLLRFRVSARHSRYASTISKHWKLQDELLVYLGIFIIIFRSSALMTPSKKQNFWARILAERVEKWLGKSLTSCWDVKAILCGVFLPTAKLISIFSSGLRIYFWWGSTLLQL